MKKILLICFISITNILAAQDLVILHTNDLHSSMLGSSPELEYTPLVNDEDPTLGGFARIAGFIESEKKINKDKVLVVDAGDYLMGTLFQTLEKDNYLQLNLMKKMGYDYIGMGNHDFDFGPNGYARIVNESYKKDEIPQILFANYKKQKDGSDSLYMELFESKRILPYTTVVKNGYKIGLFGMAGKSADESIPDIYKVDFSDSKVCARNTSFYLKEKEKCDLVVALSHGYLYKDKKGEWAGEDLDVAKNCPYLDIIVGGHSHSFVPQMIKKGKTVIVQTGSIGQYVGRLEVKFNATGPHDISYVLVPMEDNIKARADIQSIIDDNIKIIENNILNDLGMKFMEPVCETSFDLLCHPDQLSESNLGPFIADAMYGYLNKNLNQGVDFYTVARGVIRHDIVKGKKGLQNVNDIYNVMPLGEGSDNIPGSPIGKIYITGNEIKKVLELLLQLVPSNDDYYLYFTGMKIKCDPKKGLFKKISEIQIGDEEKGFRNVSFSKKDKTLYCVAANKYILGFISNLKKMSFGIVDVIGKNKDGSVILNSDFLIDGNTDKVGKQEIREWIVLYDYFKSLPDLNGNGVPDIPEKYISKRNPIILTGNTPVR